MCNLGDLETFYASNHFEFNYKYEIKIQYFVNENFHSRLKYFKNIHINIYIEYLPNKNNCWKSRYVHHSKGLEKSLPSRGGYFETCFKR